MRAYKFFGVLVALILVFSLVPASSTLAAAPSSGQRIDVTSRGVTTFTPVASASSEVNGNVPTTLKYLVGPDIEKQIPRGGMGRMSAMTLPPVPVVPSNPVDTNVARNFLGINGLSHYDQRTANGGNQWSLEPPDQALCVGSGYVVEAVNTVMKVFDTQGNTVMGVTDLNTFFKYPAAIDRTNVVFGPFVTDPKCLYDPLIGKFFLTILTLDQDPATGDFTGNTHVDLAVSKTNNPTGDWFLYTINTTNGDGSLPGHPGCPCLGDQPLIGFDQNAFIISTNEFSVFGPEFNGAQVYALPKFLLAAGLPTFAIRFDNLSLEEGPAYSLQPAFPGSLLSYDPSAGGTEYFLSSLDFNATTDNRVALWALTGTRSLYGLHPNLSLNYTILNSEVYGQPPAAVQVKTQPLPLGDSLGEPANALDTNDDRMNQVQFVNGVLYSGVNTIVNVGGADHAGIAYFKVRPAVRGGKPVGKLVDQGYVAVAGHDVMFPAIAASPFGSALMTFSLVGENFFPSAAYAQPKAGATVHVAGVGAEPADGFTGYPEYGGNGVERWGDYSAAITDGRNIWMATEYIPGGPRTSLANWGTFIMKVTP